MYHEQEVNIKKKMARRLVGGVGTPLLYLAITSLGNCDTSQERLAPNRSVNTETYKVEADGAICDSLSQNSKLVRARNAICIEPVKYAPFDPRLKK